MINVTAGRGHGLRARMSRDDLLRGARHAIRIGQHEPTVVFGARFEIENAADENIGSNELARPLVALVVQTDQRLGLFPSALAMLAVGDRHDCIAIVVALHVPLETEGLQCRGLCHELTHRDTVDGRGRSINPSRSEETGEQDAHRTKTPDLIVAGRHKSTPTTSLSGNVCAPFRHTIRHPWPH